LTANVRTSQQSLLVRLECPPRRALDLSRPRGHSFRVGQPLHLPQRRALLHRHVRASQRRFGNGSERRGAVYARRSVPPVHVPDVSAPWSGLGDELARLHLCGYAAHPVAILQVWREDSGEESV
jgi:hypothetical protein